MLGGNIRVNILLNNMDSYSPILTRRELAVKLMNVLREGFNKRFTKRAFISPVPRSFPGGHVMVMLSPLYNKKGENVGEIRIYIYVSEDENIPILIRSEWTRNAFGFWYRYDNRLFDKDNVIVDLYSKIRGISKWFSVTADGTVKVSSMNRMFRKIKKTSARDKAVRVGMVMG